MRKSQKDLSPEQLEPLRHQIQEWQKARKSPGPMPEELWSGRGGTESRCISSHPLPMASCFSKGIAVRLNCLW